MRIWHRIATISIRSFSPRPGHSTQSLILYIALDALSQMYSPIPDAPAQIRQLFPFPRGKDSRFLTGRSVKIESDKALYSAPITDLPAEESQQFAFAFIVPMYARFVEPSDFDRWTNTINFCSSFFFSFYTHLLLKFHRVAVLWALV